MSAQPTPAPRKHYLQSKTLWFAVAQVAFSVCVALGAVPGVPPYLAPLFGATGALTGVFRILTNTQLST